MNKDVKSHLMLASLGFAMGSCLYAWRQSTLIKKLVEQNNLKAELLNWITTEGIELPFDEFAEQFSVKARFINMSLHL